ncbi:MAG: CBS domain-containing protein, partial [Nitrospiraceae bacterium]
MTIAGIPPGGFRTVGQIVGTNEVRFRPEQSAMDAAAELLSAHTTGAPVVNDNGVFIGFISEVDLLRVLETGRDLN